MDEYTSVPDHSFARHSDDTAAAVESIHNDFMALVSILERQLSNVPSSDKSARAHLQEARVAATRGLDLSARLIGLMRGAAAKN